MEIDAQKQLAIDLLLLGESKTNIALKVGCQRPTLYSWMKDPDFKATMEAQRKDIISQADYYITSKTKTYIDKLDDIAMNGKDQKLQAQACMYLLDRVLGKASTKVESKSTEEEKSPEKQDLENEFARFRKAKVVDIKEADVK